jgi:2-dehydro-3-deoxyglucarate aldolase
VPEAAEAPIKRVLDMGATGIIVPQVNTAQQAADVVRWAKYAPLGSRGVGLGRAHGYGMRFGEYIATANEQTVVMVQAEHAMAVQNIDAIVRVPGIDALQLGPYDLSASMGKMGQIDDPEVVAAIDKIMKAGLAAGLAIGCFGLSAESIRTYVDRGSNLICAGVDTMLLGKAAKELARELRAE